jgi:hypothetical protein
MQGCKRSGIDSASCGLTTPCLEQVSVHSLNLRCESQLGNSTMTKMQPSFEPQVCLRWIHSKYLINENWCRNEALGWTLVKVHHLSRWDFGPILCMPLVGGEWTDWVLQWVGCIVIRMQAQGHAVSSMHCNQDETPAPWGEFDISCFRLWAAFISRSSSNVVVVWSISGSRGWCKHLRSLHT